MTPVIAQVLQYGLKDRVLSATTQTRLIRACLRKSRRPVNLGQGLFEASSSSPLVSDFRIQLCWELNSIPLNTQVLSFDENSSQESGLLYAWSTALCINIPVRSLRLLLLLQSPPASHPCHLCFDTGSSSPSYLSFSWLPLGHPSYRAQTP